MRVSCVFCRVHRSSAAPLCTNCGHFAVVPVECTRPCCDPLTDPIRTKTVTTISVAAVDVAEALALLVAHGESPRDELRQYAGRLLDALRIERAAGRCTPLTKGVDGSPASDATR